MPTPLRTAMCSAMIPPEEGYSTGMSQPLNSTIFAPIWRWTAFSAVLRTVGVVASTAGKGNPRLDVQWLGCRVVEPITLTCCFLWGQTLETRLWALGSRLSPPGFGADIAWRLAGRRKRSDLSIPGHEQCDVGSRVR